MAVVSSQSTDRVQTEYRQSTPSVCRSTASPTITAAREHKSWSPLHRPWRLGLRVCGRVGVWACVRAGGRVWAGTLSDQQNLCRRVLPSIRALLNHGDARMPLHQNQACQIRFHMFPPSLEAGRRP